jgi:S-adenosylmethionine/arginine decarboxylase-like enzyme
MLVETKSLENMVCELKSVWGWHSIINAGGCNDNVDNKEAIIAFKDELITKIDMVQYGSPLIERFGEGHLEGITIVQLIRTSNLTIHFCKESNSFYLDLFSCKPFYEADVLEVIQKWFKPVIIQTKFLARGI